MPRPTRLDLTRLDERTVPSTVTATTTARPLEFTAAGTLTTTDEVPNAGGGTDTVTATNTVTLTGTIAYDSTLGGAAGAVELTGTGSGTTKATGSAAVKTSFAQVVQGTLGFADDGGTVTVGTPLGGTAVWFAPGGGGGNRDFGPLSGTGAFDVSDFSLTASLSEPGGPQTGELTVTLADKTTAPTDLAFTDSTATRDATGVGLNFTVGVTGKVMTAASHTAAATRVTASWGDGAGRTQTADLDVPVSWNTGELVVSARGLTAPTWATELTVTIDSADGVTEADEANNTWTVALADVPAPPAAPPPPEDGGTSPPPPAPPPQPPAPPQTVPAGYTVTPGVEQILDWRDAAGRIIRSTTAFEGFEGEIGVAVGDVNGDDVLDVALGAGVGGSPRVRVFDGATGAELVSVFAFDPAFRGGSHVALGDLDGDGKDELVVGAGAGGGPHVRVLTGATGELVREFFAFEPQARGGVSVAAADLNGDGKAEIVTGAGAGGGPVVAVFDGPTDTVLQRTYAGPEGDRDGITVRAEKKAGGVIIVSADGEVSGALKRFRQQLAFGEPLLVSLSDPPALPSTLYAEQV
jgi:hypothetical protein